MMAMDNPKVRLGDTKLGKGLIAKESIAKDEVIAVFDGDTYHAKTVLDLSQDIREKYGSYVSKWIRGTNNENI